MTDRAALLDALLADPAKAAGLPPEERQRLVAACAALTLALVAVPSPNGDRPGDDAMLTAAETAKRTGMSRRWLYQKARAGDLPFARRVSAHGVRFSARGIARWLAARKA